MSSSVILGTARTPVGKMGGAFASLDATELGGIAIEAALERSGVDAGQEVRSLAHRLHPAGDGDFGVARAD